jgi:hypothetical protein
VRDVAAALRETFRVQAWSTARVQADAARLFLTWCAPRAGQLTVETLTPADIDDFVTWRLGADRKRSRHGDAARVLRVLKELPEGRLLAETRDRLAYVTPQRKARATPRDAYDDAFMRRLREACVGEIEAVVRRLTVEADALLAGGVDPREVPPVPLGSSGKVQPAWKVLANQLTFAAAEGPLDVRALAAMFGVNRFNVATSGVNTEVVNRALFPSTRDAVPFFLRFLDLTGFSPEEAALLRWSDIRWQGKSVLVQTTKPRAKRAMAPQRFKNGSRDTVGGLLLLWRSASARLSAVSGDPGVFSVLPKSCTARPDGTRRLAILPFAVFEQSGRKALRVFSGDWGFVDARGRSVTVQPSRLRKTYTATRYRENEGRVAETARDHSERVSYNHYLNIPALEPLHDATVAAGIEDALQAAIGTRATIIVEAAPATPGHAPEPADEEAGPVPDARFLPVVSDERDVGLVYCRDVQDSPFADPGDTCPEAVFGTCVDCSNAVITSRKLPNILSLLGRQLAERRLLAASEWLARHGHTYRVIREAILPRFPRAVVEEAYTIARADAPLPYLAPELFPPQSSH